MQKNGRTQDVGRAIVMRLLQVLQLLRVEGAGQLTEVAAAGVAMRIEVRRHGALVVGGVVGGATVEVEHIGLLDCLSGARA